MFDWGGFLCALIGFSVWLLILFILAFGFFLMCKCGNVWSLPIIAGCLVLCGSIAIGFGL